MRKATWAVLALVLCGGCAKQATPQINVSVTLTPPTSVPSPIISGTIPRPDEAAILRSLLGGAGYAERADGAWAPVGNATLPTLWVEGKNITGASLGDLHCTFASSRMLTPQQAHLIVSFARDNGYTGGAEKDYTYGGAPTGTTFTCKQG